jgi:hypothetical protein
MSRMGGKCSLVVHCAKTNNGNLAWLVVVAVVQAGVAAFVC